ERSAYKQPIENKEENGRTGGLGRLDGDSQDSPEKRDDRRRTPHPQTDPWPSGASGAPPVCAQCGAGSEPLFQTNGALLHRECVAWFLREGPEAAGGRKAITLVSVRQIAPDPMKPARSPDDSIEDVPPDARRWKQ